ncbi:(d)CMP kinase [Kroppenstedtia pulmonis]|uniref:Cytidylate kinase n=1 Tax=Kroppenstedtia pulmonis TaxID=1380685 RepID=A0A7D3XPY9_9BACL|nr:(d)CMP kinase [Kroppenstedtia pulmonis]QKG84307.1 (d)CMP kinase [Kroppenstedtia pulmonis]
MRRLSVAIDGPAGAGKSTVARQVARQLGFTYVDTGAMYRAITWKALQNGSDLTDERKMTQLVRDTHIQLKTDKKEVLVWVDGQPVSEEIRTPEVTSHVSAVAGLAGVRTELLEKQRELALNGGVVMDGRDIGTRVLPEAGVKVFLTASIDERAHRRYNEWLRKGYSVDLEQLKQEIRQRDEKDKNRKHSPLIPAEDAVHLDTTGLTITEVVQAILDLCRTKVGGGE